jgi:gliding motility-associated lipoprotein GldD
LTRYLKIISGILGFFLALQIISCDGDSKIIVSKKRMYPFVDYPKNVKIVEANNNGCPFKYSYADYYTFEKDTLYFGKKPVNECWFNLKSKQLNATLYCSYFDIKSKSQLSSLISDAFDASNEHNVKANNRKESIIKNKNGVSGILFEIDGDVASPIQFYLTDSTRHYMRASLYFESKAKQDSTAPILKFIEKDIYTLIDSWNWK